MLSDPTSNDNEAVASGADLKTDASGQAAILLVESLIHGLIERSVISVQDAIEIVDTANEVMDEIALGFSGPATTQSPATVLASISASLRFDHPDE